MSQSNNVVRNHFVEITRGVMANALHDGPYVIEFKLQSRYHIHFWTNTFGKVMNPLISLHPSYGLNSTMTVILQR